jgi:hypothetical protein
VTAPLGGLLPTDPIEPPAAFGVPNEYETETLPSLTTNDKTAFAPWTSHPYAVRCGAPATLSTRANRCTSVASTRCGFSCQTTACAPRSGSFPSRTYLIDRTGKIVGVALSAAGVAELWLAASSSRAALGVVD